MAAKVTKNSPNANGHMALIIQIIFDPPPKKTPKPQNSLKITKDHQLSLNM